MKLHRWTFGITTLILLVFGGVAVAGCGGSSSGGSTSGEPATASPVTIAFAGGFTGYCAPYDQAALNGAKLAVSELNAGGGLAGHKVVLKSANTNSDPQTGVTAIRGLLADNPTVVFGTCASAINIHVRCGSTGPPTQSLRSGSTRIGGSVFTSVHAGSSI